MDMPLPPQLHNPYQSLILHPCVAMEHWVDLLSLPAPTQIVAFYVVYLDRAIVVGFVVVFVVSPQNDYLPLIQTLHDGADDRGR